MKLITTLGAGEYKPVTYRWNDHTYETSFIQEAFVHWLKPEVTCVLLTEGARARHWDNLRQRLQGHTQIVEVDIPDGKSEAELWRIFERSATPYARATRLPPILRTVFAHCQ
jgi:hypothetical protein